jgi:hypothetical protein
MSERSLPDDPDLRLVLRRSRAARRFSLRVSRLDGRITLTLPARASEREAMAFAATQADWIRKALTRTAPAARVGIGAVIPFEGRQVELVAAAVRSVIVEGDRMLVPGIPAMAGQRAEAFLRIAARARLNAACDRHAAALGRPYARITLRDTRSRWGSCAQDGALMFSWRLVMAPPEVLDYVAAHEVAHLAEMNHSDAFWAVVARLFPDYARQRRWLKTEGSLLHGYRFKD